MRWNVECHRSSLRQRTFLKRGLRRPSATGLVEDLRLCSRFSFMLFDCFA